MNLHVIRIWKHEANHMSCFGEKTFFDCGQKFYIINRDIWIELKIKNQYEGIDLNSKTLCNVVNKLVNFTEHNDGFLCAITKVEFGKAKGFILPMLFYIINNEYVRVRIEYIKCSNCGWEGNIANPTLPDLYEFIPNRFNQMEKGYNIPTVNCPNCENLLERYAIWVDKQ